jgi:recombinational DNA repair protein (RecF pathway)
MSYKTYITEAIVCGTKNSNTSDRSFLLLTREAGMLYANARSVRLEKSKQRFALQEFALVRATLIKGKTGWRIGSVQPEKNYYHEAVDKAARGSVVAILRQLRRFIHGEEVHEELFDFSIDALNFVLADVAERKFIDQVVQLRLLNLLGYVSSASVPDSLLQTSLETVAALKTDALETALSRALETATKASQL